MAHRSVDTESGGGDGPEGVCGDQHSPGHFPGIIVDVVMTEDKGEHSATEADNGHNQSDDRGPVHAWSR